MSALVPSLGLDRVDRVKISVLILVALLTIGFSLFLNKPGHLIGDESVYHVMTRSFAQAGSLELLNGYHEFPSKELVFPVSHPIDGRLLSQYPYLYPVLASPFYLAMGYSGLFVFNTLALLGAVWLCFATAQVLFRDRSLSLNACLILVFATYAWEYSQAAWPHAVSMLFVCGAAYFAARAVTDRETGRSALLALMSGVIAGFGVGVRIDVILVAPALVLPFLLSNTVSLKNAIAAILGMAPGLAVLAATNYAKFGILSPFSYGPKPSGSAVDPWSYLPVALAGVAIVAAIRVWQQPGVRDFVRTRWRLCAAGACLAIVLMLLHPAIWTLVARSAHGAYQLLVDLRVRDLGILEGALSRGPGGSMIYMGALKKSLLQSCPYLVTLVLPLLIVVTGGRDARRLGLLFLVPASFWAVFSYFAWHGGHSLNLRYFVPTLPFVAILTAYGWREVMARTVAPALGLRLGLLLSVLVVAGSTLPVHIQMRPISELEFILLTIPLCLACLLLALLLAQRLTSGRLARLAGTCAIAGLVLSFAWAGTVALTYDFPRALIKRSVTHRMSAEMASTISANSILFVEYATPFSGVYETDGIRLAQVTWDDFAGFRPLVDFHLGAGRPVYVLVGEESWDKARRGGLLDGLELVEISNMLGNPLMQLVLKPAPGRAGAPQRLGSKPNLNDSASRVGP
ncbi:MAG: glycosyltransferase family 39 protein [Alphaproteobacteria bacterium]|nr:glycosyltransferase family 39 protein [Alphaproteobacteria bacterium]